MSTRKSGTSKAKSTKASTKVTTKAAAKPRAAARPARSAKSVQAAVQAAAQAEQESRAPRSRKTNDADTAMLAEAAARNTLAVNPLIGIRASDFGEGAKALFGAAVQEPIKAAQHLGSFVRHVSEAVAGKSSYAPDPKDKRFLDPAWQTSAVHKRLLQAHAAASSSLNQYIGATGLGERDKARAQLAATIFLDAIAPSNTLINPASLKRAVDTGGASWVKGFKNLVNDLRHNHFLPSSVDKSKFELGVNLALTPGKVVFKNEVLELIQYQPQTPTVYQRPLVICPPQVNKYYAMDLSPEKSLMRFAVSQGIQVFAVSWFNPTKEQRDWNMSTYVEALDAAVDVARHITGSPDVSLWGACSGGMTTAAYTGWLAATGQHKVANIISPVCVLNPEHTRDTTMGLFISEESVATIKAAIRTQGVMEGKELARVFAWLRPNDLIWNYWINNYLLGNDPPAFDILFWNADTTRLPAAFHADLLDIMQKNPYMHAGAMQVLGVPIDMEKVDVDAYIVAGVTDHITPWKACYQTAQIYGKKATFTLANAGHLQSLLNPPGAPKSFFFSGDAKAADPDGWAAQASRSEGSWWPHWMAWLQPRSGEQVAAPKKPGNRKYPAGVDAPGEYVLQA